jgi:hypothetical protein
MELTRGMLGVRALQRRRRALSAADGVWEQVRDLDGLVEHPYVDQRWAIDVPGAFVRDRSMLIFRTREDYRRPPTRAQEASLEWRWPVLTAALLANFRNFLAVQDQSRVEITAATDQIAALQAAELDRLPAELRAESPSGPALRSMLARVMRVMLARG